MVSGLLFWGHPAHICNCNPAATPNRSCHHRNHALKLSVYRKHSLNSSHSSIIATTSKRRQNDVVLIGIPENTARFWLSGAPKSRDLTTRHQIKQIATSWTSVGPRQKSNVLNDKRIKSCLLRFDSGAYSRLQFLRAVSHSVSAHTESLQPRVDNSSNSNSSEDENENRPTSGASESATAAAAPTSDDCCKVCIVSPCARAGFALVPCGHRTRRQYTRRCNDDKENF